MSEERTTPPPRVGDVSHYPVHQVPWERREPRCRDIYGPGRVPGPVDRVYLGSWYSRVSSSADEGLRNGYRTKEEPGTVC